MVASTPDKFVAACIQMCSGRDVETNVETALSLVTEAARAGAHFVATPEMTSILELDRQSLFAKITDEANDRALSVLRAAASDHGIWLLIGSLPIRLGDGKAANRSFLVGPDGGIRARYDKIHMFDVDLANGESYRESASFTPGEQAVVADLPWGRLGMTVCYDLRFPHLFRTLASHGASILAIPAAFTRQTGEAHWHVLQRARAIENGAFVIAPAQGGRHENGRETFGHSMIVAPWGEILAEAGTEPGVITAEIDMALVAQARSRVPSLRNGRAFADPEISKADLRAAS
jgi:predicted amidohydrolase